MVRRCSDKIAKSLLVVFNLFFFACGIALIAVGATDIKDVGAVQSIVNRVNGVNGVVIGVGVVVCIISFLGCCGSLQENSCMINTFMAFLVILLISEVVIGYKTLNNSSEIDAGMKKNIRDTLKQSVDNKLIREAWDDIQVTMHCCGCDGYQDYLNLSLKIPASCCMNQSAHQDCTPNTTDLNRQGCFEKMKAVLKHSKLAIGIAALFVAFIEVIGIIFACCLRSAINERFGTV